jgi:ketosteroid isomerase-like protein
MGRPKEAVEVGMGWMAVGGGPRRLAVAGARRLAALAALGAVAGAAAGCRPGGDVPGEAERARLVAEAEATVAGLFEALNAGDPEGVLDHYLPTEDFIQIACTTIRPGFAQRERVVRQLYGEAREQPIEAQVVSVQPLGRRSATVAARGRGGDGTSLFWTFVLVRDEGGAWRIAQEHQSWPGCREVRERLGPSPHGP